MTYKQPDIPNIFITYKLKYKSIVHYLKYSINHVPSYFFSIYAMLIYHNIMGFIIARCWIKIDKFKYYGCIA